MLEAFQRLSLTSTQYYTQISTNQFSERLLQCPPIKRLDSLTITNFKSFKGKVYVGPLLDFTSIVGPNGAGKSNVLDALMFAFCNEKSKVTFFDVREFINREGIQTYKEMIDKNKFCEVEVKFQLINNRYFTVTRTLYPDEQQTFLIDGDDYPQKVYENFLMKNNINYITSNYAIWQGQIDKLLMKNPKELTNYIEIISGSTFFKKDQEDLKEEIKNIEDHMNSRSLRIAKLRQEKKLMKTFNHQKKSSLKIEAEYELVLKQLVLAKALLSELDLKDYQKAINVQEKEEQKKIKQINETKAQVQREQAEKIKLQMQANTLMRQIAQTNTKLRNIGQLSNVIDVQTIGQLTQETESLQKYCNSLKYRRDAVEKEMSSLPSTDENKEYLNLYNRWEKQNQAINKELTKRKEEYLYTQGILQSKKNIMEEFNQKMIKIDQTSKQEQLQKVEIGKNVEELEKNISKMQVQHAKMTQEFSKSEKTIDNIQKKIIETNQKIIDLETIVSESLQSEKDKGIVLKLNQIQGFKGLVQQWLKPSNKKYEVCFQMIVGSIFKYLLCVDEASSKQISIKLRENYQIRNLIILSNVRDKKESVARSTLGKEAVPAIDAIEFDKKLQNFDLFLTEYLNGKVICETLEAAWQLLGKNIRGIKQIYTLDGNCLRQDGVVSSHGSIQLSKKKYRYADVSKNNSSIMQQIQSLKKQKLKAQQQLQKIKKKSNQELLLKHSIEMQKLKTKNDQLHLKLDLITKSIQNKKESKIPKGLEQDIQELQKRAKSLYQGMAELEKQMLKSHIFSDFLKKSNISDLDSFRSVQDLSSLEEIIKAKHKYTKELQQIQREIEKITSQINQKEERLQRLKEKVDSIKGFSQKSDLEKMVKHKEKELTQIRAQLSKVKNVNPETLKFKSEIIQMTAKLQIMKERHGQLIKGEAENLGLAEVPSPSEYHLLEEPLGTKIQRASRERVQILQEELQKEKKDLESELQRNNISLTDVRSEFQNEENLEAEISRITEQLKQENERKSELNEKLDKIKEDRKSVFMNYMSQLKPILTQAYQILTERDNGSGRVDIFMENEAFPCDDGLYYTPVPPTKRFVYDLDQLSGGEKSIASLALQYSIALASKSPFLILDQTDAFLDSDNTKRFINLIKKTLIDRKLQFIIITHKRSLFLSGESLVGVTKFKDDPFSKAFSLRINEPGNEDEEFQ